jgi:hypothetical protein
MMKALMLVLLLAAPAFAADDDEAYTAPDRSVTLDAQARGRLGIATAQARAMDFQVETRGFGQVMSVDALGQTDADLTVAESAARASQSALERAENLYKADTGVSRQVLEQAQHQAATDAAQLTLAQRKAIATWGHDAPWRDAAERRALMAKIASGNAALVRATLPQDSLSNTPPTMRVEKLDQAAGDKGWSASMVWSAPADPTVPGRSFYMLVENAKGLLQGDRVRVIAGGGDKTKGAVVPADSVLIAEGKTWVYIEEKPNYFVRQAVDTTRPTQTGYFVPYGIQPGEAIVTRGAAHLLAKETGTED